jgi:hypothetical protein
MGEIGLPNLETLRKSVLGKFPFFFCLPTVLYTAQQEILKTACRVEHNIKTTAYAEVFCPRSQIRGVLAKRAKSGAVGDVEAVGKLCTGMCEGWRGKRELWR